MTDWAKGQAVGIASQIRGRGVPSETYEVRPAKVVGIGRRWIHIEFESGRKERFDPADGMIDQGEFGMGYEVVFETIEDGRAWAEAQRLWARLRNHVHASLQPPPPPQALEPLRQLVKLLDEVQG